jgi:hypothetical protein
MMPNHEEIEQALRELFENVRTVPGTFPPVYTCGDFLIGFDRQGQIKVTGSIQTEPDLSPTRTYWLKRWRARVLSSQRRDEIGQKLPDSWFKRWFSERGQWVNATDTQ